jgi:hypothetical protein
MEGARMSNFFSKIASGFVWLGKEIVKVADWLPRVVTLVDDVEEDAATILPQLTTVIEDVETISLTAVKDSGGSIAAAEALVAAIVTAAKADGLNIASDTAVVAAFQTFIADVTAKSTWTDLIAALQKLVTDYDALGASAKAAIQKLESDATV